MKVRFEIFKSFIRVDLQLQLEVKVAFTKENPSSLTFFWEDRRGREKKKTGGCGGRLRTWRCFFFSPASVFPKKTLENSDLAGGRGAVQCCALFSALRSVALGAVKRWALCNAGRCVALRVV